ncbi:restriction endonuclease subunit S [Streptococcus equi subsp. zooepidemicus]|uniref:restriction endonuclease subunit S n=1 Tax=Streptococcus equi TaxID=1336 RepID=UPI001E3D5F45|nr:restriction endonuclease subunit S [Streptococcus equi]MCD3467248.1 restriction endonuclease subunit S [Streptococcus equi subsp. zooepidemicus]HEL1183666.1 restriction endonuclease subunit S [Streptococcus equi subsp. zooepidemicus]
MFGELGKDQKGWGLTRLGECCEVNPKRPRNIDDELMVSFVPMPAVSEDGKIDCSDIKPYKEVRKGFTYFAENDVLFAKITPCMENGKGAVAKGLSGGIGSGSTEFHVLRPIEGKSNPYWLYIITMFESFRVGARKVMTGTGGQLRVPVGYLSDFPISLPPISLQNSFEEFVHQSDKSKFVRFKSQFIEMFGELDKNTKKFPIRKLNEISAYWNGLTYKPADAVEAGNGTLVLRSSNIQDGALAFDDNVFVGCAIKEKLFVQDNDILMCSRNGSAALVGKTALIKGLTEPTTFGAFMMIIRSDYYSYLKTYFETPFFRNQISTGTSTINQITGKMLNEISLPVPDMDTVRLFEEFTHQSDKSK